MAEVVGPADQPAERAFGAVLSGTGDAARYFVVFGSDPLGAAAIDDLTGLRGRLPALLRHAGLSGAEALVAGDTAVVAETIDKTVSDLWRVAPIAIIVFLAGRIWDEARKRPLAEAVPVAGARAATPITIAGLVLAASFALPRSCRCARSASWPSPWPPALSSTRSSCARCSYPH